MLLKKNCGTENLWEFCWHLSSFYPRFVNNLSTSHFLGTLSTLKFPHVLLTHALSILSQNQLIYWGWCRVAQILSIFSQYQHIVHILSTYLFSTTESAHNLLINSLKINIMPTLCKLICWKQNQCKSQESTFYTFPKSAPGARIPWVQLINT